jgi:hypothetical protein
MTLDLSLQPERILAIVEVFVKGSTSASEQTGDNL